jgi:transposase
MEKITTIGLDLAKNVFQVHGVDGAGNVLLRKQLRRGDVLRFFSGLSPCLVGMEACATAHYWARELAKLGHTADSGDVARLFRDHVARCSDLMSPA